jgi:oxygen-independent coproporphyrinogen-3 oxidase
VIASEPVKNLYVNLPFCPSLCGFCNFYKNDMRTYDKYFSGVDLARHLLQEIQLYRPLISNKLASVYFGGGSPLEIPGDFLKKLLTALHQEFDLSEAEITVESNPFWAKDKKIYDVELFNRISIGVQSFDPGSLKVLHRSLSPDADFLNRIGSFIPHVSVDMVYDIPGTTADSFLNDVRCAVKLDAEHLSWYSLEITSSVFEKKLPRYEDDSAFKREWSTLLTMLGDSGYERYEISNFAKKGQTSKHNMAYWEHRPYLGIGPGAFGALFLENEPTSATFPQNQASAIRYRNKRHLGLYLKDLNESKKPWESSESLSVVDLENEFVFLSLRRSVGLDLTEYQNRFGKSFLMEHQMILDRHEEAFKQENGSLKLTESGLLYYNSLCSDLMI